MIKFLPGRYGEIEHINLKHDPMTGRSRGFAFIVFKVPRDEIWSCILCCTIVVYAGYH